MKKRQVGPCLKETTQAGLVGSSITTRKFRSEKVKPLPRAKMHITHYITWTFTNFGVLAAIFCVFSTKGKYWENEAK